MHNPQTKKLPPPRPEDLPRFFASLSRAQLEESLIERDRQVMAAKMAKLAKLEAPSFFDLAFDLDL